MSKNAETMVLANLAVEADNEGAWIAPIPDGPVVRLEGAATVLLDFFTAPSTIDEAVDACLSVFPDAPPGARATLTRQAEEFVAINILIPAQTPLPAPTSS